MKTIKKNLKVLMAIAILGFFASSCEKDKHVPPSISFKTTAGYTSGDGIAARNTAILVGVIGDKQEDDMTMYNVSVAYDGSTTTTTFLSYPIPGADQQHFDKDVTFITRNQAGTEKWLFTITDADGNIAQKQVILTVP